MGHWKKLGVGKVVHKAARTIEARTTVSCAGKNEEGAEAEKRARQLGLGRLPCDLRRGATEEEATGWGASGKYSEEKVAPDDLVNVSLASPKQVLVYYF